MSVTLEIPAEIASSVRVPPQERQSRLMLELAVALYSQNLLPSGKACALAGLTRLEWEELLGQRKVLRHYSDADLAEDLSHGKRRE
jgi:predicted HTH domain antitoxin